MMPVTLVIGDPNPAVTSPNDMGLIAAMDRFFDGHRIGACLNCRFDRQNRCR